MSQPSPAPVPPSEVLGYVRVSREEQARADRTSLTEQRERITARALTLGTAVSRFFEDPGVSGGTAEGRPGFMALVAYCRAHPQPRRRGVVLVLNDSRWGRFEDPVESSYWRFELEKHGGWRVRFVENDDSDNVIARHMMRSVFDGQATAYRQQVQRNAKQGARGTAAQGYWQNEAPFGYRRCAERPDGETRTLERGRRKADDERVRLVPGPAAEVAAVRWMFATYAAGGTPIRALARELKPKFPVYRWAHQTVVAMLRNQAYCGDVLWCRHPHDKHEREESPVRPEAQWVVVRGAHPALVSREVFAQVRERLAANRERPRAVRSKWLLSGLMTCAQCGKTYSAGGGPLGPPDDLDRHRIYRDGGGVDPVPQCPGRIGTVRKQLVEPLVVNAVAEVVDSPELQRLIEEELDRVLAAAQTSRQTRGPDLDRERARLAAERDRIVGALARGLLREDEARATLDRLASELDGATKAREQLRFAARRESVVASERDRLLALARDFRARMATLPFPARRELLKPWVESLVFDKVKRTLTLTIRRLPVDSNLLLLSVPPVPG